MKKSVVVIIFLFIVVFVFPLLLIMGISFTKHFKFQPTKRFAAAKIAVIYINGVIIGGKDREGFFDTIAGSENILDQLKQAKEDISVKAIVLRINSPGGSAAAAQEIYQEIQNCQKENKKIVVSMSDVAASGGYYIASAADKIVANPATLTGSIGVIMELENLKELFKKIGIEFDVIKSGEHKDIGSPVRKMTLKERKILQGLSDDIFDQFVEAVAQGRKIKKEEIKKIADGRVFTGRQAKKLKLIDELGNFPYSLDLAAKISGIKGKPKIIEYRKKHFNFFDYLFSSLLRINWEKYLWQRILGSKIYDYPYK